MGDYEIKRTDQEINDVLNDCMEQETKGGSRWPAMTYEQGVAEGLRWVTGQSEDHPTQE